MSIAADCQKPIYAYRMHAVDAYTSIGALDMSQVAAAAVTTTAVERKLDIRALDAYIYIPKIFNATHEPA